MILGFRFKLKPTAKQHAALAEALERSRLLYNAALEERIDCYRKTGKGRSYFDQCKALTELRKDGARFSAVMERAPLKALDDAYKAFFARGGFPRFKGRDWYKSIGWPERNGWGIRRGRFIAKGLGAIRIHLHREMRGEMRSCNIKRQGRHWYLSVACEVESSTTNEGAAVGIDMGIASLAILSDGTRIENPRLHRKALPSLRRAQRALARCKRGSNRRRKVRERLARIHARVRNQRSTYLHQVSAKIVKDHGIIAVEALRVKNMSRSARGTPAKPGTNVAAKAGLNRSINDASWGRLKELLRYKTTLNGGRLIEVNPSGTSQACSGCGVIVPKPLNVRWHECPECGLSIDRDHNAALNVLHRAVAGPGFDKPLVAAVRSRKISERNFS